MTFSMPKGTLFPPEFLPVLRDINTLAELKVTIALLAVSSETGIDARGLTFDDLEHATSLARGSVNKGIKLALERQTIVKNGSKYEPNWNGMSKYELHVHDMHVLKHEHDISSTFETCMQKHGGSDFEKILITEFGLAVRVARDICERYPTMHLFKHVHFARYARSKRIARNLQGWLVASVRDDWGPPKGFRWLDVLKAQGWTDEELFKVHYEAQEDGLYIPEIEDTMGYAIWLQSYEADYEEDDQDAA